MREEKRRRLEAKGWRVGTTAEFLGLSPEESAYVELKVRLAEGLRALRRRQSLTQADLAKRLQSSQSRIAKMEAGDPSVSLDLLIRSLLTLGASRRDLSRIMADRSPIPAAHRLASAASTASPLDAGVRQHSARRRRQPGTAREAEGPL